MSTCVKICRECGEEYRPETLRCADCGGELDERFLDEAGEVVEPEASATEATAQAEDLANHRVVFVTPRAADLVPLAEALRENEVPYRLAEQTARAEHAPPRYALLVPDSEAAAALRTLAPFLAPEAEAELAHCPACGAARAPGATECAECGLGLADEAPPACARCGAPVADPEAGCPACGGTPVAG